MQAESTGRVRAAAASAIVAASAVLHVVMFRSAGPYWRDEINSIRLASAPSLQQFLRDLPYDGAPALWFALLRVWMTFLGRDTLRIAGLLIGLGLLALLFLRGRLPVLALAVIGTSGAIVLYGDTARPYGLAMMAAAGFYLVMERGRWIPGALLAIAAVHLAFHNAAVVFAVCVAAAIVRKSIKPLLAGAAAAASLLPYVPMLRATRDFSLTRYEVDVLWVWHKFDEAMSLSGPFATRIWIFLLFVSLVLMARAKFAALVLLLLTISYTLFLWNLAYLMQPWYFLPYLAVAALAMDDVLTPVLEQASKWAMPVLALLVAASSFPSALHAVRERRTNMDVVARAIPADSFVIVYPWYLGISFSEYSKLPFDTMPEVADHRLHRYDLVKAAVDDPHSGEKLIARARKAGTVYLVGFPPFEESGAYLDKPQAATGIAKADLRWSALLTSLAPGEVVIGPDPNVSAYERVMLVRFRKF